MDKNLEKLCNEYEVDLEIIENIIQIEKDNVHKKSRHGIFNSLKYIINQAVKEGDINDN